MARKKYIPNSFKRRRTYLHKRFKDQAAELLERHPDSTVSDTTRLKPLIWKGRIQPTLLSCSYLVRIELHHTKEAPVTTIVDPSLEKRESENIPHLYEEGSLCLHRPSNKHWKPGMSIADTIIPWTSLWLYYYEEWHRTGIWHGGGEHPEDHKKKL